MIRPRRSDGFLRRGLSGCPRFLSFLSGIGQLCSFYVLNHSPFSGGMRIGFPPKVTKGNRKAALHVELCHLRRIFPSKTLSGKHGALALDVLTDWHNESHACLGDSS